MNQDDEEINKAMNDFVAGALIFFFGVLIGFVSYELYLVDYFVRISSYLGEYSTGCGDLGYIPCDESGGRPIGWTITTLPIVGIGLYAYLKFLRPRLKRRNIVP